MALCPRPNVGGSEHPPRSVPPLEAALLILHLMNAYNCASSRRMTSHHIASHHIASHRITSKHMTRSPYRYQNEPAVMPYIPEMRGYVHCTNKGGAGMEGRLMLTRGHCWWYSTMTGVGAPHQRLLEVVP